MKNKSAQQKQDPFLHAYRTWIGPRDETLDVYVYQTVLSYLEEEVVSLHNRLEQENPAREPLYQTTLALTAAVMHMDEITGSGVLYGFRCRMTMPVLAVWRELRAAEDMLPEGHFKEDAGDLLSVAQRLHDDAHADCFGG